MDGRLTSQPFDRVDIKNSITGNSTFGFIFLLKMYTVFLIPHFVFAVTSTVCLHVMCTVDYVWWESTDYRDDVWEGEKVPFTQEVYPDGNVEDWLLGSRMSCEKVFGSCLVMHLLTIKRFVKLKICITLAQKPTYLLTSVKCIVMKNKLMSWCELLIWLWCTGLCAIEHLSAENLQVILWYNLLAL